MADSFDKSACRLSAQARLEDAIPLYRMSLDIRKKLLGQDHLAVATSLNNLGVGLKRKGHLQEAEDAYMHSLAIRKQALGEEHVIVAQSFHNLAALKEVMGEQQAAEELYRKAIKACPLPFTLADCLADGLLVILFVFDLRAGSDLLLDRPPWPVR